MSLSFHQSLTILEIVQSAKCPKSKQIDPHKFIRVHKSSLIRYKKPKSNNLNPKIIDPLAINHHLHLPSNITSIHRSSWLQKIQIFDFSKISFFFASKLFQNSIVENWLRPQLQVLYSNSAVCLYALETLMAEADLARAETSPFHGNFAYVTRLAFVVEAAYTALIRSINPLNPIHCWSLYAVVQNANTQNSCFIVPFWRIKANLGWEIPPFSTCLSIYPLPGDVIWCP